MDEVNKEKCGFNNNVEFVEVCGNEECWIVDVIGDGEGCFKVFWGL